MNSNNKNSKTINNLHETDISTLDEFVNNYQLDQKTGTNLIFSKNLDELKSKGYSVELLLDYLSNNYGSLFIGSTISIPWEVNGYKLKPNKNNLICATNIGAVAILNALINKDKLSSCSSNGVKLPSQIDSEHPFKVEIYGLNYKAINEEGYVYVINKTEGFIKSPFSNWQFLNKENKPVLASTKIPVNNYDFKHSINDMTGNRETRFDVDTKKRY